MVSLRTKNGTDIHLHSVTRRIAPPLVFSLTLLSLLFFSIPLSAQEPRWTPRAELEAFAAGKPIAWENMIELALIAGGASAERLPVLVQKVVEIAEDAVAAYGGETPERKADLLLQYLHKNVFRRYEFTQTRLDRAIEQGSYNCVSSALLYFIVGQRLGLEIQAIGTRDHAFCIVGLPDRDVDVETTTALGFDPGKKREFHDAFGKLTGFAYVPATQYSVRSRLDFRGLVGLLLQNLIAEAQDRRDMVTPIGLAVDRYLLEAGQDARGLLDAVFKNYVSSLVTRRVYDTAIRELDDYDRRWGPPQVTADIRKVVVNNKLVDSIRSGKLEEARADLTAHAQSLGSDARTLWESLNLEELNRIYKNTGFPAVLDGVRRALDAGEVTAPFAERLYEQYVSQELAKISSGNRWSEALVFFESLPQQLRGNARIAGIGRTMAQNLAIDYHNRFANLMNAGKRAEAMSVLEEGLSRLPGSDLLLRDKARLGS